MTIVYVNVLGIFQLYVNETPLTAPVTCQLQNKIRSSLVISIRDIFVIREVQNTCKYVLLNKTSNNKYLHS